jgi:hypothetical protein
LLATGGVVLGVIGFLAVGSCQVSRCARFMQAIDFKGVFAPKSLGDRLRGVERVAESAEPPRPPNKRRVS